MVSLQYHWAKHALWVCAFPRAVFSEIPHGGCVNGIIFFIFQVCECAARGDLVVGFPEEVQD